VQRNKAVQVRGSYPGLYPYDSEDSSVGVCFVLGGSCKANMVTPKIQICKQLYITALFCQLRREAADPQKAPNVLWVVKKKSAPILKETLVALSAMKSASFSMTD
jgi:hypothetical protein